MRAFLRIVLAAALHSGAAAHAAGKTHAVRIENFKFVPERLEVAAGDTIVWTNKRSEEHTSELQSRFGISYAVFCLKKKKKQDDTTLSSMCTSAAHLARRRF